MPAAALARILDGEARAAAGASEAGEIDRLQVAAELRVAKKDHLLPLDHAESVVLNDDDLDRELVFDAGAELSHEHRKAAIPNEGHGLSLGVSGLGGDGKWPSGLRTFLTQPFHCQSLRIVERGRGPVHQPEQPIDNLIRHEAN